MDSTEKSPESAAAQPGYTIKQRYGHRDWMVIDPQGELVCLTVYKRGATEVVRRLTS